MSYTWLPLSEHYADQLEAENAELRLEIIAATGQAQTALEENDKLRELIAQCADDFEAAADGGGVNFYQCAVDLRAALLGGEG